MPGGSVSQGMETQNDGKLGPAEEYNSIPKMVLRAPRPTKMDIPTVTIPLDHQRQVNVMPEGGMEFASQQEKSEFDEFYSEALAGNFMAMNIVGFSYEKGKGVEKNLGLAKMWYDKASLIGNDAPRKALTQLEGPRNVTDSTDVPEGGSFQLRGKKPSINLLIKQSPSVVFDASAIKIDKDATEYSGLSFKECADLGLLSNQKVVLLRDDEKGYIFSYESD